MLTFFPRWNASVDDMKGRHDQPDHRHQAGRRRLEGCDWWHPGWRQLCRSGCRERWAVEEIGALCRITLQGRRRAGRLIPTLTRLDNNWKRSHLIASIYLAFPSLSCSLLFPAVQVTMSPQSAKFCSEGANRPLSPSPRAFSSSVSS